MKEKRKDWEQIADRLIKDLEKGKYQKGEKLPSENEMAGRYGVPRSDIRKIYGRLKELGYLYSLQGGGSFFAGKREKIPLSMVQGRSFTQTAQSLGLSYQAKNVQAKRIRYNPQIFDSLGLDGDDSVWKIGILRILDGSPAVLHIRYLPEKYFPRLPQDAGTITSFYTYLKQNGYGQFYTVSPQLTVGFLTKKERERLNLPYYATGLIYSAKTIRQEDGAVLELCRTIYRSDRFIFLFGEADGEDKGR